MEVESLQQPNHQRGDEDDREGTLQEVLGLVPQQVRHVFEARQAVVGQLHHKGCHVALVAKPLGKQSGDDADNDAQEIQADEH